MKTIALRMLVVLIASCLLLCGCAATAGAERMSSIGPGGVPMWVTSPDETYPPAKYITALGAGRSLDEAERDAHDKLARRFRVMLDSRETHQDRYRVSIGSAEPGRDWQLSTSMLSTVELSAHEQLLNAQILQRHIDDDDAVYALGAIERLPTARLYAEQMRINQQLANAHLEAALETPDAQKIRKLAHLKTAERAAAKYYALAHIHDVLAGPGGGLALLDGDEPDLAAIQAAQGGVRESVAVRLSWERDAPPAMRDELQRIVNDMGLAIVREGAADLALELSYTVRYRSVPRYGLVHADWRVTVGVGDAAGRRRLATLTYADRDGSGDQSGAMAAAEHQATMALQTSLPGDLMRALYNEDVR